MEKREDKHSVIREDTSIYFLNLTTHKNLSVYLVSGGKNKTRPKNPPKMGAKREPFHHTKKTRKSALRAHFRDVFGRFLFFPAPPSGRVAGKSDSVSRKAKPKSSSTPKGQFRKESNLILRRRDWSDCSVFLSETRSSSENFHYSSGKKASNKKKEAPGSRQSNSSIQAWYNQTRRRPSPMLVVRGNFLKQLQ